MKPSYTLARAAALASLLCLWGGHALAARPAQRRPPASRAKLTRTKTPARDSCPAVEGTVYDVNRAVVVGARVRLFWYQGETVLTTATDDEGRFRVAAVEPGTYSLLVESRGFESLRDEGLKLEAGESVTLDVTLEVAPSGSATPAAPALR